MLVNAMFYVAEVTVRPTDYLTVVLLPVTRNVKPDGYESPNVDWSKYTPGGRIEMTVSRELGAADAFLAAMGQDIPITFTLPDVTP